METVLNRDESVVVKLRGRVELALLGEAVYFTLGGHRLRLQPFTPAAEDLVRRLRAGVTEPELAELLAAHPHLADFVAALRAERFTEALPPQPPAGLDPRDIARFDRLLAFFAEYEAQDGDRYAYLQRLQRSTVAVVGLGGLGSWVVYGLVACGVGNLVLIDGDRVEASNLNRSILFDESDIGELKVEAAARAVQAFAPRVRVQPRPVQIDGSAPLVELARGCDVLVGLADQPLWLIRQWVAEAAATLGIAALQGNGGTVGPFQYPAGSSCAMCEWQEMVERRPEFPAYVAGLRRLPRGTTGALSPLPAMASSVIVMDIFRYLARHRPPVTHNAVWEAEFTNFTARVRPRPPHPRCPVGR